MLDKKTVEEYQKIKPDDGLKQRIAYRLEQEKQRSENAVRKPLYLRLRPMLAGTLACVLLICCLTVLPFDLFANGDMNVSYAQSGEMIIPSSREIRAYSEFYFVYDRLPTGQRGAELTFECGAKTEVKTDFGSIYLKNADGSYKNFGEKTRIDGEATLFLQLPEDISVSEVTLTLKNRFGEWSVIIECFAEEYKANLVQAE